MKKIFPPKVNDYPAQISDVAFAEGDFIEAGTRLCVLQLKSGRRIAIKAPSTGQIHKLYVKNGGFLMETQIVAMIDETVTAPPEDTPEQAPVETAANPTKEKQSTATVLSKKRRQERRDKANTTPASKGINFIIWQGWGWLLPIVFVGSFAIVFVLLAWFLQNDMNKVFASKPLQALMLMTPAIAVGLFGIFSNQFNFTKRTEKFSRFLFIRGEFWAALLIIASVGVMFRIDYVQKQQAEFNETMKDVLKLLREETQAMEEDAARRKEEEAKHARENARYSFETCNRSNKKMSIALAYYEMPNDPHPTLWKWAILNRNECKELFVGKFGATDQQPMYFVAHKSGQTGKIGNVNDPNALHLCLDEKPESYLIKVKTACRKGTRNLFAFFDKIMITRNDPNVKIDLR